MAAFNKFKTNLVQMIFLKSTKGKTYEAKLTEGGYKLYRVDEENERNLLSADGIQIDNQTPYPALISVDKNGIFNSAKHSIPIKFNYAIIDFALRSLCFGLFMIGFLGKLDFWVLQIVVIGPVLFYQAVKKQEKTVLRWQQSYRLHYEESFAIKFELDKLIFELKYNRLFFIIPLIQAGIGTYICWLLLDLGFTLKVLLCFLLFFILLYYSKLLCHAGLITKIPLNNLEEIEKKYRLLNRWEIIDELQTGTIKESKIELLDIIYIVTIYLLIFHLNEENIEKITRFVISIYHQILNLYI
jgi:hypothetical protein